MSIPKHAHKLKRKTYKNGERVFFCTLDCPYKVDIELSLGKTAECWRCGKPFQINEYSIRLAKPHCNDCTEKKEPEVVIPPSAVPTVSSLKERLKKVSKPLSAEFDGDMV